MKTWAAIVVAAGRGIRFGRPKQLLEIAGSPMLLWSLRVFTTMPEIHDTIVVTERDWLQDVAQVATMCAVVPGGATRQASVYAGICALPRRSEAVLIHDGARPLIAAEDVRRAMEYVRPRHAAVLGVPVVDTIKAVDGDHVVRRTFKRDELWAAQTPQLGTVPDLRSAHESARREGVDATDDAMLLERIGVTVHMVQGSPENFKVTVPEDLTRAEAALRRRLALQGEKS